MPLKEDRGARKAYPFATPSRRHIRWRFNAKVPAETPRSPTTHFEQHIESERRRLLQVHSVLHCLYEVLLYAEGEGAIMYAEAAHLAAMMVDETAAQLDWVRIKPLIDAMKMESGGSGGGGFAVREPPPYLLS